ncbi:MAG: hypothetical protein KAI96_05305 [Thermodesulfovibrionia bacterium]|nr:hypothetical protein [Thermodesulfovibrionia bacterium]
MIFDEILHNTIALIQSNMPVSIAIGLFFIFLVIKKPKLFFAVFFILMVLLGALYVMSYISSIGVSYKKDLLTK